MEFLFIWSCICSLLFDYRPLYGLIAIFVPVVFLICMEGVFSQTSLNVILCLLVALLVMMVILYLIWRELFYINELEKRED